jgi:hypothetical protein
VYNKFVCFFEPGRLFACRFFYSICFSALTLSPSFSFGAPKENEAKEKRLLDLSLRGPRSRLSAVGKSSIGLHALISARCILSIGLIPSIFFLF